MGEGGRGREKTRPTGRNVRDGYRRKALKGHCTPLFDSDKTPEAIKRPLDGPCPADNRSLDRVFQRRLIMKLRFVPLPIILAVTVLAAGVSAGAQEVRVEVVEATTGKPIVGANVALLDSAGAIPLGGGFSDQGGRTDFRAPVRGPFRVRADKSGYDTWLSVQLHLGDQPVHVRIGMAPTRTPAPMV